MTSKGERFRVITGEARTEPARADVPGPRRYACSECTAADPHGLPVGDLVQIMTAVHEMDGQIVAGQLWWACSRCMRPKFHIRDVFPKRR